MSVCGTGAQWSSAVSAALFVSVCVCVLPPLCGRI